MAKAKKSKAKKSKAKKAKKTTRAKAAKKTKKRTAASASRGKAKKSAPRKTKKAAAKPRKPATKSSARPKKKQIVGEGDYQASRSFLKDENDFVARHSAEIPAMGKAAEAALEGPEGGELRAAEEEARSHSKSAGE
jgi:hypothetical protein